MIHMFIHIYIYIYIYINEDEYGLNNNEGIYI